MDRQPRITDLVPQTIPALLMTLLAGAAALAGIEALYYLQPRFAEHLGVRITAFDLTSEGSLGAWFSSTVLFLAAGAALIVYSLRRHRADDYHGRYRIWLVAAGCWFLLSVDEAASLHEGFKDAMVALTGERGFGDGAFWWVAAYGLVLGLVGLQLVMEMRECRTSTALFLSVGGCYAAAVALKLDLPALDDKTYRVMLKEGLEMAGGLLLVLATAVHVRYVVLEIEGVIEPRQAKPKKEKAETAKAAAVEPPAKLGWFRRAKIDPPHAAPSPAGKTTDLEPVGKSARLPSSVFRATAETVELDAGGRGVKKIKADFDDDEDDDDRREHRKLSRAERKALRKQKEAQRRGYGD